jgi:hypothetical protein
MIIHVLNRGNARDRIFEEDTDFAAFERALKETQEQVFVRVFGIRMGTDPDGVYDPQIAVE